jgi:hypothetical protein
MLVVFVVSGAPDIFLVYSYSSRTPLRRSFSSSSRIYAHFSVPMMPNRE